jgi:hypothetical protein
MPHTATVTAQTGPAKQLTAAVIPAVLGVDFQLDTKRLFVQTENAAGDNIKEFDLSTVTVVTVAITGGNWAVTVS